MAKRTTAILIAAWACATVLGLAIPDAARAGTCPWGGDESQSMRCFDCMRRVWTGERWALRNTCSSHYFNDFSAPRNPIWR